MDSSPPGPVQVRVEVLPAFYNAVIQALRQTGLNASQLNEIAAQHLSAGCVQCGRQVTGETLERLALATGAIEPADSDLSRLRQGYCAQRDCQSYYYQVAFRDHAAVDWAAIVRQAGAPTVPPANHRVRAPKWRTSSRWEQPLVRAALGVGIVLVLLLIKYLMSGGSVPLLHRDPGFRIDPASLNPGTVR